MLAELRFGQFNNIRVIIGNMCEAIPIMNKVYAVDLRTDKNGFRIVIGDDDSSLGEQMGWIDLLEDAFRDFNVGLHKNFPGAIREVDADFQRRTNAPFLGGARVDFKCNHILR